MSAELRVPGNVLQALSPIPTAVVDEHGTDVTALLADASGWVALSGSTFTIPVAALVGFHEHVLRCLGHIAGNRTVQDNVRAWLLHRALRVEVERIYLGGHRATSARGLHLVTRFLAREGMSWPSDAIPSYGHRERMETAYTPVTHAVNAALHSTALAAAAGENRDDVLQGVVLAGVFADTGIDESNDGARVERAVGLLRRASVGSVAAVVGVLGRRSRWDGKGIPRIAGSLIPFEARCTAIACDYDLLTLDGSHGRSLSPGEALAVMVEASGTYDPALLRTFIRMIGGVAADGTDPVVRSHPPRQSERVRQMLRELRVV